MVRVAHTRAWERGAGQSSTKEGGGGVWGGVDGWVPPPPFNDPEGMEGNVACGPITEGGGGLKGRVA